MFGYAGQICVIDLSSQSIESVSLDTATARKYIGGSGLGTYYLTQYGPPEAEALAPQTPLIFMTGPYLGAHIPTSGRHHIITKSPLTGIYCEADAGGSFGHHLKMAGYDGLIILGKAESPVFIRIDQGRAFILNADHLWGLDTYSTEKQLRGQAQQRIGVSCIGPSGEKMVPLSGIFHDGIAARTAARGGAGAVMGAKRLKAIAVSGTFKTELFDPEWLRHSIKKKNKFLKEKGAAFRTHGTAVTMEPAEKFGDLPIKNWNLGSWEKEVQDISGPRMTETILEKNYGCVACPVRCGRIVKFEDIHGSGPEYESLAMLGSACLVHDLKVVARANDLCNRYGIDTMSVGGCVAFAMELVDQGILSKQEIGFELQWGDGEGLLRLVECIGEKKGIGAILGQGVRAAARTIGRGAEEYAIHCKGLEMPGHDPRCFKGLGVGYATSNRGACHLSSFSYPWERSATMPELGYDSVQDRSLDAGKGKLTARLQDVMGMADSLKICKFAISMGTSISEMVDWLNAITGWDMDSAEFMQTGARIFTLKRLYNIQLGISRKDDTLPRRITSAPRNSGGSADTLPDLNGQLEEYYDYRGWNEQGYPLKQTISQLGLEDCL